jgi:hypothetical protein
MLIEALESYTKQTYRNRCIIAGPNGRQVLTIPIIHAATGKMKIRDVQIDNSGRWQAIHHRSIEAAYNRSPFYDYYKHEFEPFFIAKHKYLFDLNNGLIELCLKLAGIKTEVHFTEHFKMQYEDADDLRTMISPKNHETIMPLPRYPQVFEQNLGFLADLSMIDLLFNRGPDALNYLVAAGTEVL